MQISASNLPMSTAGLFASRLALLHPSVMKRPARKSNLQAWQQEDADRLKALLRAAKDNHGWPGFDEFASTWIGKSGSYLSQLAGAYRPINLKHAIGLARGLGVDVEKISPTLARELAGVETPRATSPEPAHTGPQRNRRASEYERSVFRALATLEPAVKMSIESMILALAAANSARYAQWSADIERFNHDRDASGKAAEKTPKGVT